MSIPDVRYVKRKDEDYIYAATPTLLTRDDMHACDKDGNLLYGVATAAEATGLRPRREDPQDEKAILQKHIVKISENVAKALKVSVEVALKIINGEAVEADKEAVKTDETKDTNEDREVDSTEVRGPLKTMNRKEICAYAMATFGEAAEHLDPEMPRSVITEEIERLELEAEED